MAEDNKFAAQEAKIMEEIENNVGGETSTKVCSKCDGTMIEASFEILNFIQADFGHNLLVGPHKTFYINPKRRSQINVYVCRKCGYIELYASDPTGL
jgi:DNA-directed RNA polymerase subunit M/transcription elongation factor TFIIS